MPNVKWTAAELAIWNIFLVAAGAGVMGGIPALMQYLSSSNVDVVFCLKLALAGGASAFGGSILTYFRKNGLSVAIQAILDALGQLTALTSQVHAAVTTQGVATPQPVPVPPQSSVLSTPLNQGTAPVQMPIVQPSGAVAMQPYIMQPQPNLFLPNLNATATAATPQWIPASPDVHFGDSQIMQAIPKP